MKKSNLSVIMFVAAATVAALGCLFLWYCPAVGTARLCSRHYFDQQLLWNAVGVAAFAGAWALGWKRLLKAAPCLAAVWVVLLFMALAGRPICGAHRWADLGIVRLNVWTAFWPVAALFVAWLYSRRLVRPWMVYVAIACFLALTAFRIFSCPHRVDRLMRFAMNICFGMNNVTFQSHLRAALSVSDWFGGVDRSLYCLAGARSEDVVSGSALVMGKWLPSCAILLMAVIAACLARIRQGTVDPAKRMYLLVFGTVLVGTALMSSLQCIMLAPCFGWRFSWLSYGGTDVLFAWLGLGVAASVARDGEATVDGSRPRLAWGVPLVVAGFIISAFEWMPLPYSARYSEPMPRYSELGEFGIQPVRGTVLAADGTVLAKSVGEWQVHVDPKVVCYGPSQSSNDVVEAVSKGLGLSADAVRAIYSHPKSRYVLARTCVEGDMLTWCQTENNARRYGLVLERIQKRWYPLGIDAAHVTGFCAGDGIRNIQLTGAAGLEHACRKVLAGTPGKVDLGQTLAENRRTGVPTNGGVVRTTIQVPVQRAMSEILSVAAASNGAESAWAIAVRIPRGEIAAMSAWPAWDPNAIGRTGSYSAMVNGAVQTLHEPGGLMKPLAYALAMDAGCVKPGEIRSWDNAVFTNLCHAVGTNVMWHGLLDFGFGQKLGEGTLCGEEIGIVYGPERWSPVALDSLGIGQGLAVTGVQLAQAYASLANGGVRVTPYLVESMEDVTGRVEWAHAVKPSKQIVSSEAAAAVAKFMLDQTNDVARGVAGLGIVGKASTFALVEEHRQYAEGVYSASDFDALYAGFFPSEKPTYAVVVGFRKPRPEYAAEKIARPVFEQMAEVLLRSGGHD